MSGGASVIFPNPEIRKDLVLIMKMSLTTTYGTFVSIVYCFPKILKKEKRDLDFLQEERIVR